MKKNSTFYIHCFAHQLQLAFVAVGKNHTQIALLFKIVSSVLNFVGAWSKCRDILWEKQEAKVIKGLNNGELSSGRGLNQETYVKQSGDTH